jgi:hypothetical protein
MFKYVVLFFHVLLEKIKDPFDVELEDVDCEEDDDALDDEVEKQAEEIIENILRRRARRPD